MKERLDLILVQKGLVQSRDRAKRLIMAGLVSVDGRVEDKAGQKFDIELEFTIKEDPCKYVSRGGLKLEKALEEFEIKLDDAICVDMGASTGGFTDCMLQNGARKVYAIDVGYGQLDYRLRTDPRVVNIERTNIRYLDCALIKEPADFISIDVSFISLKHMFPIASEILDQRGGIVALVKPQFEAGREQVGKNGIVKDKEVHAEVLYNVFDYAEDSGFFPYNMTWSPVKGAKGNIEYLMYLKRLNADGSNIPAKDFTPDDLVYLAHQDLKE